MRWSANPTSHLIWLFLSGYYSIYCPPSGKLTPHTPSSLYTKLYMRHVRFLRGLACIPVIGTHTHQRYQDTIESSWTADPRPASLFALFLRVPQAEPCRRQDNGSYPLSTGVQTQVHIWVPPTHNTKIHNLYFI